jgi:hypothetical protein
MPMRVSKVSGCDDGTCPAVYVSDAGTTVVQGALLPDVEGVALGRGEQAIEMPPDVLLDAVPALIGLPGTTAAVERLRAALSDS